jgi:PASTA domain-containing protein
MHTLRPLPLVTTLALAGLAGCGDTSHHAAAPAPAGATRTAAAAPALVAVPQLVGRRQADAHRLLARAGLRMRWTGFTGKAANGRYNIGCVKVLRQSPVAGERRPRGARIAVIEVACRTPHQAPHGVAR